MPNLTTDPRYVFRDFETDQVPSSGVHKVRKEDARSLFFEWWQALIGLAAEVGDFDLPNLLISFDVTGGDQNAIEATANLPVPETPGLALFSILIEQANTGDVTINGKPLLTNSGNQIGPGGLANNSIHLFLDRGDAYRLVSDQASAAIIAAAEAWANQAAEHAENAEAAAILAASAASADFVFDSGTWSGDEDSIELLAEPTDAAAVFYVEGGVPQRPGIDFTIDGVFLHRTEQPEGGTPWFYVIISIVKTVLSPSSGSVTALSVSNDPAEQAAILEKLGGVAHPVTADDLTDDAGELEAIRDKIGAGTGGGSGIASWGLLLPETETLLEAWQSAGVARPRSGTTFLLDYMIAKLIDENLWDDISLLYLFALHDEQAARINIKSPGTHTLTAVNAPVFEAGKGFTSNGGYLTPGISWNTLYGGHHSSHALIWSLTDVNENVWDVGAVSGTLNLITGRRSNELRVRSGSSANVVASVSDSLGLYGFERPNTGAVRAYKNGAVAHIESSNTFTGHSAGNIAILGHPAGSEFSTKQIAFFCAGPSLGTDRQAKLYGIISEVLGSSGLGAV